MCGIVQAGLFAVQGRWIEATAALASVVVGSLVGHVLKSAVRAIAIMQTTIIQQTSRAAVKSIVLWEVKRTRFQIAAISAFAGEAASGKVKEMLNDMIRPKPKSNMVSRQPFQPFRTGRGWMVINA